ncbi:MAG: diaminopimelate epimerase [Candidatus Omnitrophica bacterium]|nr:diaminopimelate epimerase [Candidatus Omnitrophota bacterium]
MEGKFYKMCASGNDFIVIDNQDRSLKNPAKVAKELCQRRLSVGADGLLVLEPSKKNDIKMRIFNADGSEAEMCGNGARCAALFCNRVLKFDQTFSMETLAGTIDAVIEKGSVKVKLPDPTDFRDLSPIEVQDGIFYFYFLNTSVPHAVIFEEFLEDISVPVIGREIRHHEHFEPEGTNVNFVRVIDQKTIEIRTYERGVEDETLACGTGATASAIVSALINKCKSPVSVKTKGGEVLTVSFDLHLYNVENVYLEGSAQFVYEGSI